MLLLCMLQVRGRNNDMMFGSLIPRPFSPPIFHRFQYGRSHRQYFIASKAMKYWRWERPGNEARCLVVGGQNNGKDVW